jgi:hypothetical protein
LESPAYPDEVVSAETRRAREARRNARARGLIGTALILVLGVAL